MDELKPCPFCGGKAEIIGGPSKYGLKQIRCTKCCNCTAFWKGRKKAIEMWNIRVDNRSDKHE